ncbi:transcriptional regulator, GntR family with aminotransferase domain [Dickeya chrysanthemi Ech1591]|uniref:Transcriptional regulator, GntR family with aminotransferase domain n=1 Tax=Dickeya chrysanthemi (strain Ech1591) TaxID=561229 RepID=C6CN83_DICC1|nr:MULTISPECIES: PLP-dependent aminotransferase family protein [Dickeya]ACT08676.1 transcriptional regulator, GntR family with aminotransferase domain [Dickeya chrysanthemi Ech1591]TYL40887.1 PLP-dependent aminotransferase family protein [Dickeya sp. ws52]WJM84866.1 PLP-dependent aminotransferase family protein [Dickeya chrysanthemi]
MTRYQRLATLLTQRIEQGLYQSGERLPSVRSLSQEHGVSISTVQQAYHLLEEKRLIVPLPRSGYFVKPRMAAAPIPAMTRPVQRPVEITRWNSVLELLRSRTDPEILQLGGSLPDLTRSTLKPLWKSVNRIGQKQDIATLGYDSLNGLPLLREQIARLMIDSGCQLSAQDIIVTHGCTQALSIAIRAVCNPGDIVAIESPVFHCIMQILCGYGIKVIEIPTDFSNGISLEALELALEQWPVKAVLTVPNCNNPLGFVMPEHRKRALMTLAQRYDIAIIEDDVYGDLTYDYPRPITLKSLDYEGRVLTCSSFSKTLAPGLRIGWVVPGRYLDRALHMKYTSTGAISIHFQQAVAEFIQQGYYMPHVRRMRSLYQRNLEELVNLVRRVFPDTICHSRPQGGFVLWVELPEAFDGVRLNHRLVDKKIRIHEGELFSASGKYRHCLRLSYAQPLTPETEAAIITLGNVIVGELASNPVAG